MPKLVHFGEFLKIWRLRSNSVTRQINFNRTKIGGKCQNSNASIKIGAMYQNKSLKPPKIANKAFPHCLKITQNVAFEFLTFWQFPQIFVLLKLTCLVTLFDRKLHVFKNSPNWPFLPFLITFCLEYYIVTLLWSTQNVNVARFDRNVEWDFFCDFQTPWHCTTKLMQFPWTIVISV